MSMCSCLLIFALSLLVTNATEAPSLAAVFVVIRHGDRSPTSFYPNDPFQNASYWPEGIGELNKPGIERMTQSGTLYQQRYESFLQATDGWPSYVKSSIRKRTIDSANLFMTSFLSKDKPSVNVSEMIQLDQLMLTTTYPCNKSNAAWLEWFSSSEVTGYIDSKRDGIMHLENLTGDHYLSQTPFTLRNLEFLSTTLEIERDEYHLNVSDWAKDKDNIALMADLKSHAYQFDWRPPVVQRYRVGPLLGDIGANIGKVIDGSSKQRFFLYSTHDVNQVLLLQALNLYDQIGTWPPSYSSAIVFEVYNRTGDYLLRLMYRQVNTVGTNKAFELVDNPLKIGTCNDLEWSFEQNKTESLCSYANFQTLIRDKVPVHYDEECRTSDANALLHSGTKWLFAVMITFALSQRV